jgi:hypothetical protein
MPTWDLAGMKLGQWNALKKFKEPMNKKVGFSQVLRLRIKAMNSTVANYRITLGEAEKL